MTLARRFAPLLLLAVACQGGSKTDGAGTPAPDCDPAVGSVTLPDPFVDAEILHLDLAPSAIDPATDHYPQSHHQLFLRTDGGVAPRDELFLMLPGTANLGQAFEVLGRLAAKAGYPVLVVAYDSEVNQAVYCADITEPEAQMACRTAVLREKAYGEDLSDRIDIDEANAIVGRARRVIERVDEDQPELGAAGWLDGDALAWDRIVLAGFSQGAGLAGLLSHDHAFARAIFLAGGCDSATTDDGTVVLSDWCYEARATPAERTFAFRHTQDEPEEDAAIHDAAGLFAYGDYADAPDASPDYCTGTHLVESDLPSNGAAGDHYHLSVAHDDYLPVDEDGVPLLAEDYLYLFLGGNEEGSAR